MKKYFKILSTLTVIIFFSMTFFSYGNRSKPVLNISLAKKIRAEVDGLSKTEMQSIFQFFGDDLFEGRAPGTRGGRLAERYIRSLLKFLDIGPLNKSYLQPFKLKGFKTDSLNVMAGNRSLKFLDEVLGTYIGKEDDFHLKGNAVFIGFGTKTELWDWDDYKNFDINNKFVIARVNDPGMFIEDIFEGKILTYFGRWTYHIEEAKRRGAKAILLIHTDASAGYGWNVVRNSWSGEELYLESSLKGNMKFSGWIKESGLRRILASKGIDLEKLYSDSLRKNFKPVPLDFSIEISGKRKSRELINNNVIGYIPGRSEKSIVISAHIDHLGMNSDLKGDGIYNGAIDNGTAVTSMILTARILKKLEKYLKYSIIVLAPNAEESGLLGSKYFIMNCDKDKIIANVNFESTPVWGKSKSIIGIGARFSSLEDKLELIAEEEGLEYKYFSMSNQGFFFRSDQFPFAMENIPSLWISTGENDDSGNYLYKKFWTERYHTVKDEYDPQWSLEGLRQTIKYALLLIEKINAEKDPPRWKRKLTFPVNSK